MKLKDYLKVNNEIELRKIKVEDSKELFQLIESNRAYLRNFLPWLDVCRTELEELRFIEELTEKFLDSKSLDLSILYNGKIAGVCGTHEIDWSNRKTSLGYWIGETFQGHGIVTQSCESLIKYIFDELKLHRIEIYCAVDNLKSQKIAERLGFKKEGVLTDAENLYGKYIDLILYSLINL